MGVDREVLSHGDAESVQSHTAPLRPRTPNLPPQGYAWHSVHPNNPRLTLAVRTQPSGLGMAPREWHHMGEDEPL